VLPKVAAAADIVEAERLLQRLGAARGLRLWAMMETPVAVLRAGEVAAAGERLDVLVMGTNDLLAELHGAERPDRRPLETSMALCVLAARAAGRMILDGVYNDVRDAAGFEAECRAGRDLGFDGKTLIHPGQIESCNRVYSPSREEIEHAQRVVAVFEQARESGAGVATLDGRLVEALHVQAARRVLAAIDAESST
jgi:citrate lyase subunit beta/citryl-CoA lyase